MPFHAGPAEQFLKCSLKLGGKGVGGGGGVVDA